jgi:hypothetical protein
MIVVQRKFSGIIAVSVVVKPTVWLSLQIPQKYL